MAKKFRKAFGGFGQELLDGIRTTANQRIADATDTERNANIQKATMAMLEAGVDEEIIIKMLQKHWDLRQSEANSLIENAKQG